MKPNTQGVKQEDVTVPGVTTPANPEVTQASLESMEWLPCSVTLDVPAVGFTIDKLLRLSTGMLVETGLAEDKGIPVQVNGKEIGLSDIETVEDRLAFRITELL